MLYSEYVTKAKQLCIEIDQDLGFAYLNPEYKYLLYLSGLKIEDISDFDGVTQDIIDECLKLSVEKYNVMHNYTAVLSEYIIKNVIPFIANVESVTETPIVKELIEYYKDKEGKNNSMSSSKDVKQILPSYFNFNKKDI